MAEFAWTAAQHEAIHAPGPSVWVTAGAGSGKTAVLAERCAHWVASTQPPCPIDRVLVVTFTDAAAAEMRERIGLALRAGLAAAPNRRWLREQLVLLDNASICTLHAFCRRIIDQYFTHCDVDPQAPILDEHEAHLLRLDTARRVFDEMAERPGPRGEEFLSLVGAYGGLDERPLIERVLEIDDFLASLPEPQRWIEEAARSYAEVQADRPPGEWIARLRESLSVEISAQETGLEDLMASPVWCDAAAQPCLAILRAYRERLSTWMGALRREIDMTSLDRLCIGEIGAYKWPAHPRLTPKVKAEGANFVERFKRAQDQLKRVKEKFFVSRLQKPYGRFTCAQWAEGIVRTAPHVRALLGLLERFRRAYQAAKADLGVLDFADLERTALDLLRASTLRVADVLRERYEHILVDEYQDVSPIQAAILASIRRSELQQGSFFAVGDVKQSIYRFRLAEPRLFRAALDQAAGEKASQVVYLQDNFRSHPRVIEAINAVCERLMAADLGGLDYDEHARLHAGRTDVPAPSGPALQVHILDEADGDDEVEETPAESALDWRRIEREAYVVAQEIHALTRAGVSAGNIVVLMRSLKPRAALFVRTLMRQGVGVSADLGGAFFESLEVMDVLNLLELLDNEQQDIPLAALLRGPMMGEPLSDAQLVEIRASLRGRPFHEAVRHYATSGRRAEPRARLADTLARLADWRRRCRRIALADALWLLYQETGIIAYVSGLAEGAQRRANLLTLHHYARQFGGFQRQGLARFLRFLAALAEDDREIDLPAARPASPEAVRVMTIHRSKGLEFPIVILAEAGREFNLREARGAIVFDRRLGLGLRAVDEARAIIYPTLPHQLVSEAEKAECLSEELRLLYVALTRARSRIVVVGTKRLSSLDGARENSPVQRGPLPLLDRLAAQSTLDWIVRAVLSLPPSQVTLGDAAESKVGDPLIGVRTYSTMVMAGWSCDPPLESEAVARIKRCAALESWEANEVSTQDAAVVDVVARRLTTPYPASSLTQVPAVVAASELKSRWMADEEAEEPPTPWHTGPRDGLATIASRAGCARPSVLSASEIADPISVGTWTHQFLRRVDLTRSCTLPDLREQLRGLIAGDALRDEEASKIDLDALAWFFGTELGRHLRRPGCAVYREWPFVIGVDPRRYQPDAEPRSAEDFVLVRGIVDCLFDAGDGWRLLDYKTDAVQGAALGKRAAFYRGQLDIYASAIEVHFDRPVRRRSLVFLAARQVVDLDGSIPL